MRTKNLFITSAALLVLASCSSDFDENSTVQNVSEQTPVSFGAYSAQSTKTRSAINNLADLATPGFGVFAYFTDADDFDTDATPNFMYNQQVTGTETSAGPGSYNWTYSPLKFWPNDIASDGAVDSEGATGAATGSKAGGKISFFAYAPYKADATSGNGITAFTTNDATGTPKITYQIGYTNESDFVDLLWGTAGENTVEKIQDANQQNGSKWDNGTEKVWLNITRPEKGDKIKFNFLHALSKFGGSTSDSETNPIGGIRIVLNPDDGHLSADGKADLTNNTKVTVKSIKITPTNADITDDNKQYAFYQDGTFDLGKGTWSGQTKGNTKTYSQTIKVSPGTGELELADDLKEDSSDPTQWNDVKAGVTLTPKSVFKNNNLATIYAVPGCSPKLTIEINYVVRTQDTKLAAGWTTAEQTIKKNITMPTFELNKAYGLLIRLGLTSVKFDATVSDWERGGVSYTDANNNTSIVTIVDLPADQ